MKCDSVQGLRGIRAGESRALGTICPPGASLSLRGENGGWGGGGGRKRGGVRPRVTPTLVQMGGGHVGDPPPSCKAS